jgi:predicted metal-binding protein
MADRAELEQLLTEEGFTDYRWIDPRQILVAQWVRMKCTFGCGEYGHNATCPPYTPSVAECRRFFDDYGSAVVLHFEKRVDHPNDRHAWSRTVNQGLARLERAVFMAGFPKAFVLFMDSCTLCTECTGARTSCKNPRSARPSPEAMAVDVFGTVRPLGLPIEVLTEYGQAMNRYAFLLIE